jgi:Zn-dependent protease with chaperone function
MNMPPISVAKVTQTLLQPLVASEQRWETDGNFTIDQLNDNYNGRELNTSEANNTGVRWRGTTRYRLLKYNIFLSNSGQLSITRQLPWYTRFILLAAFVIGLRPAIDGQVGNVVVWHFVIPAAVTGVWSHPPPVSSCTELVTDKTHPLPISIILIGTGSIMIHRVAFNKWVVDLLPVRFRAAILLGGFCLLAGIAYLGLGNQFFDTVDEEAQTEHVFTLPLNIATVSVAASIGSVGFFLLTGTIGVAAFEGVVLSSKTFYSILVLIALGTTCYYFVSFLGSSARAYRDLKQARLRPFESSYRRLAAVILFLLPNIIFVSFGTVLFAILGYGITGDTYAPAYALAPVINSALGSATVPVPEFLRGAYVVLDSFFQTVPIGSPRAYSIIFVVLLSWPVLFILFGTIAELLLRPYRVLSTLARSRPLNPDSGQQLLPDDIEIRQIERGANLKPVWFLFGWREYVIVSDSIVDQLHTGKLQPKQFEAILRHEEYHLRERHYTILAACLGPFVGGRNALLAFKDYRASEEQADEYAIRQINQNDDYEDDSGEEALRNGLGSVIRTQAKMKGTDELLPRTPGIVRRPPIDNILTSDDDSDDDSDDESNEGPLLVRANRWLSSRLRMTYGLYFGSSLVQTAHREEDERLDELTSEDDN